MSDDSQRNSAVRAATTNIHHVNLQDLPLSTARRLYKGGVRPGEPIRSRIQAQEMLDKIPPSQRAGMDNQTAANNAKDYLSDKHASHVKPHSKGGSNDPSNIRWENGKDNNIYNRINDSGNRLLQYLNEICHKRIEQGYTEEKAQILENRITQSLRDLSQHKAQVNVISKLSHILDDINKNAHFIAHIYNTEIRGWDLEFEQLKAKISQYEKMIYNNHNHSRGESWFKP